jgi:hypothetical protein
METKLPSIDYELVAAALRALRQAHNELDGRAQTAASPFDAARLGRCAQAGEGAHRALSTFLECMAAYGDSAGALESIMAL